MIYIKLLITNIIRFIILLPIIYFFVEEKNFNKSLKFSIIFLLIIIVTDIISNKIENRKKGKN